MANDNCVLCHPGRGVDGKQWMVLCPACMDRLMCECKNLAKMEEWIRAEHAAITAALAGQGEGSDA